MAAVLDALESIQTKLYHDGWEKSSMGCSYRIDYNYRFDLYVRMRNLASLTEEKYKHFENVCETSKQNIAENKNILMVSKDPMGPPTEDLTPYPDIIPTSSDLPVLSAFENYPSLMAARTGRSAIVISYDSEWFHEDCDESGPRILLSWQFAVIEGDNLKEFVFLRKTMKYNLSLEIAIGRILDHLVVEPTEISRIREYTSLGENDAKGTPTENWFSTPKEAIEASKTLYNDGKKYHPRRNWSKVPSIPVILLCHAGKVDLSALDQHAKRNKDILRYCSEVQGGLVSLQPTMIYPDSLNPKVNGK